MLPRYTIFYIRFDCMHDSLNELIFRETKDLSRRLHSVVSDANGVTVIFENVTPLPKPPRLRLRWPFRLPWTVN